MTRTFEAHTALEAVLLEQALLMARALQATAAAAPDGQVLARAELVALRSGREFTRRALEAALQGQADAAQNKGPPAGPVPAGRAATSRARRTRRSSPPPAASA